MLPKEYKQKEKQFIEEIIELAKRMSLAQLEDTIVCMKYNLRV